MALSQLFNPLVHCSVSSATLNDVLLRSHQRKICPKPLKLDEGEREQLQQLVNRHHTPQQLALRASIILLADQGRNHQEIARELQIETWQDYGEHAGYIESKGRGGSGACWILHPQRLALQLFALACERPDVYGRPISDWTARELAEEIQPGDCGEYFRRHVGRLLFPATDFATKSKTFEPNLLPQHERLRVISLDEMTGIQALERKAACRCPGKMRRREFEYSVTATQTLIASFEVVVMHAMVGETRTEADYLMCNRPLPISSNQMAFNYGL